MNTMTTPQAWNPEDRGFWDRAGPAVAQRNLWVSIPALALAISAIGVVLFSAYILYDINRIVQGGETNYITATLAVYLDIYNVFVSLLNLLMMLTGERD